jgi:hypothetical protein
MTSRTPILGIWPMLAAIARATMAGRHALPQQRRPA